MAKKLLLILLILSGIQLYSQTKKREYRFLPYFSGQSYNIDLINYFPYHNQSVRGLEPMVYYFGLAYIYPSQTSLSAIAFGFGNSELKDENGIDKKLYQRAFELTQFYRLFTKKDFLLATNFGVGAKRVKFKLSPDSTYNGDYIPFVQIGQNMEFRTNYIYYLKPGISFGYENFKTIFNIEVKFEIFYSIPLNNVRWNDNNGNRMNGFPSPDINGLSYGINIGLGI